MTAVSATQWSLEDLIEWISVGLRAHPGVDRALQVWRPAAPAADRNGYEVAGAYRQMATAAAKSAGCGRRLGVYFAHARVTRGCVMLIRLIAIPLMVSTIAVADAVPKLDVTPSCQGAAAAGFVQQTQERLQQCIDSENRTRDKLQKDWATFSATDRAYCLTSIKAFAPTYTELATCLEIRRDARNIKSESDTPPITPKTPRKK
jgi:hypothetical protein